MCFLDGGYVENQASRLISQYQLAGGTDKLKLIMTNSNTDWEGFDFSEVLQYFDSPFGDGIDPGGRWFFLESRFVAMPSPQVFQDIVTPDALDGMLQSLPNSNMTTAIMTDFTTIDNPVYGIKAGLKADLMLINLNEPISTFLVRPGIIQESTVRLSEMARDMASNTELVQRVKDFYDA